MFVEWGGWAGGLPARGAATGRPGSAAAAPGSRPPPRPRHSSPVTQVTLQYTVWDHIKEVEASPVTRLDNLAGLVAALLAKGALPLTALKVV